MEIVINNNRRITAIQEEFSTEFPGLSIAFYAKPSKPGSPPSKKLIRHSGKKLQDVRAISNEGTIDILPTMNVSDVMENFRDVYGLSVEIFRKSGTNSEAMKVTENMTLAEIIKSIPLV